MARQIPETEFGGVDGDMFANARRSTIVDPYLEAVAYRQSVGRIDAQDKETGRAVERTPGYGSAGRPA